MNKNTSRQPDGTFAKGTSGNPKGRPRSETVALRNQIAPQAAAIVEKVIEKALDGDLGAAKLILDRLLPPLKPITIPTTSDFSTHQTLTGQAKAILDATSRGEIPSDIASQLIQAVSNLGRIIETEELQDRIKALETAIKPNKHQP